MDAKHTPGPWEYNEQTKTIRSKKENFWLATMDSWDGSVNNAANARLIAAAPDLLAALENARIALTFYRIEMARDTPGKDYPFGIDCENAARAAVARAKRDRE
jgi:hypothetical protein